MPHFLPIGQRACCCQQDAIMDKDMFLYLNMFLSLSNLMINDEEKLSNCESTCRRFFFNKQMKIAPESYLIYQTLILFSRLLRHYFFLDPLVYINVGVHKHHDSRSKFSGIRICNGPCHNRLPEKRPCFLKLLTLLPSAFDPDEVDILPTQIKPVDIISIKRHGLYPLPTVVIDRPCLPVVIA